MHEKETRNSSVNCSACAKSSKTGVIDLPRRGASKKEHMNWPADGHERNPSGAHESPSSYGCPSIAEAILKVASAA